MRSRSMSLVLGFAICLVGSFLSASIANASSQPIPPGPGPGKDPDWCAECNNNAIKAHLKCLDDANEDAIDCVLGGGDYDDCVDKQGEDAAACDAKEDKAKDNCAKKCPPDPEPTPEDGY